jgi:hypothetical protein
MLDTATVAATVVPYGVVPEVPSYSLHRVELLGLRQQVFRREAATDSDPHGVEVLEDLRAADRAGDQAAVELPVRDARAIIDYSFQLALGREAGLPSRGAQLRSTFRRTGAHVRWPPHARAHVTADVDGDNPFATRTMQRRACTKMTRSM